MGWSKSSSVPTHLLEASASYSPFISFTGRSACCNNQCLCLKMLIAVYIPHAICYQPCILMRSSFLTAQGILWKFPDLEVLGSETWSKIWHPAKYLLPGSKRRADWTFTESLQSRDVVLPAFLAFVRSPPPNFQLRGVDTLSLLGRTFLR